MATGQTAAEELEELLSRNADDPAWCGQRLNHAVTAGAVSPETGRSIWHNVFNTEPSPALQADDGEGAPRGGAVAWAVLVVLFMAGIVLAWLLSEWLAAGGWLR